MITSTGDKGRQPQLESQTITSTYSKGASSSRRWSAFKNPRIVQASHALGGKDRHSKVCTIKGLRDRRIRLSVPTAIQLYDLQHRLSLNQPSKVIDWLLEATKHDIDKLPPLQMPLFPPVPLSHESNTSQSFFSPFLNSNQTYTKEGRSHPSRFSKQEIRHDHNLGDDQMMSKSRSWDLDLTMGEKLEKDSISIENNWWMRLNQDGGQGSYTATHFSFPSLPNNVIPNNSYHWEPSSLSLSQFGSHGVLSQLESAQTDQSVSLQPSFLAAIAPPVLVPYHFSTEPRLENDSRKFSHFQLLNSPILPNTLMSVRSATMDPTSSMFNLHPQNNKKQENNGSISTDS